MESLTMEKGKLNLKNSPMNSPGDFKFHFSHYTGALSVAEMQKLGWCILDGTTAKSQLVDSGYFTLTDLAITGILDNLILQDFSGRAKSLFVRSGNTSGIITEDSLQGFKIAESGETGSTPGLSPIVGNSGSWFAMTDKFPVNDGFNGDPRLSDETKPASITAIPMMYCLK